MCLFIRHIYKTLVCAMIYYVESEIFICIYHTHFWLTCAINVERCEFTLQTEQDCVHLGEVDVRPLLVHCMQQPLVAPTHTIPSHRHTARDVLYLPRENYLGLYCHCLTFMMYE